MSYQDEFVLFWEQIKESVQHGSFAKLTMAKTIGKPELRNIFIRPIYSEGNFKVLLKLHYRSRDIADNEKEISLNEAFEIVQLHLKNPFLSILLFTTTKDITFKINKKGAACITESSPTFHDIVQAKMDDE